MTTVASKVPFYQLAVLMDKIHSRSGTDNKKRLLKEFMDEWRAFHNKIHKDEKDVTDSFFNAMRLLLPQLEREREAYGIKEHLLAKHYIDILGLGKDSPSAQKLLNYRSPKSAKSDAGDFASVAYWILKDRCPEKGDMTIEEVNNHLNQVASCNAAKDKEGMRKSMRHMLCNMSAREQKWLIRIIMKELKMGISQQSIFSIFHQDAEDLYNVKMSLEKVCTILKDPSVRLHEVGISLFTPFRPMLGDRGAPSKVEKLFDNKPFFLETKFDGERMQLHKEDDEYRFFSRGGNDYTSTYGNNSFDGSLVPYIHNCFQPTVRSCILDGEMVGYNPETKTVASKGGHFDVKSRDMNEYQPMLYVFDVLMLNDQVLSNKPLRERLKMIKDIFTPAEGRIMKSEYTEASTRQECIDALNDAIDRQEEGIMVKNPESPYKPNTRKGGWYKMKPEYVGGLMDELDVLVVGGLFGVGTRSNLMSHFLCAVALPPTGEGGKPTEFHTFCKVGSGYSRSELHTFNQKLVDHWKPFSKKSAPDWLKFASGFKQRPDAYIEPDKSCILQIKAAEITDSDQYKTGCTLRFPRVEKIRTDKPWYDCMTTTEVDGLRQRASGKLANRYEGDENDEEPTKKRRKITSRSVKPTVMAQFRGVDAAAITKVSEMFAGKEICVVNGPPQNNKAELEKKILEYGGVIVQNPGEDTFCVLADKVTIKLRNIMSKGVYDVVRVGWLLECVLQKRLIPWIPSDMLHTSPKMAREFALSYDKYGDSYYDETTEDELRKAFDRVAEEGDMEPLTSEDIAEIEMQYFPQESTNGLFRLCKCYMDDKLVLGECSTHVKASSLELVALELRMYGGSVLDTVNKTVSHVVVNSLDTSRVRSLREVNKRRVKKFHIVSEAWVYDCIKEEKLLPERQYEPA